MKHISAVDNVANLRALVRHELREISIKVPKPKKSKRATNKINQDVTNEQIFGNHLSGVHCVHVPECGYVAKFLVDAAEIIIDNIDSEGVFRKSGAVSRQKEIKTQLESGKGFVGANVYDVTALVKQFFRELPEPLFTSVYHDTFIRCYQLGDLNLATKAVLMLCLLLPDEHASTLRYIMKLLSRISEHSEKNKMDSANLAVVLAPNLMHMNSKSETMKSGEEKLLQVQTAIVELLIKHADAVCMVDEELAERTVFMSEVFSTDDELDASEDNLDDTKENRKKDKKRKRSGSFQGIVSSIAQSISKWRRSTDGKTNTSGVSNGSNVSQSGRKPRNGEGEAYNNQVFQFAPTDATPIMKRNKHQSAAGSRAFSASKKKAILNQLPQHATLASTPFTPVSSKKPHPGMHRAGHDMPSIPPRPYQTPRQNSKSRKKITLFSPASTTKKKRYSSTSNLSMSSNLNKAGKSKSIFRRLSGSKGDQAFAGDVQIGQRLAVSPVSTQSAPVIITSRNTTTSPIAAIAHNSSVCEQSTISTCSYEDRNSLNEGFIHTEEREGDITRIMSEPAINSSQGDQREYVNVGDMLARESFSDSMLGDSRMETPQNHSRSQSCDSILDGSTRRSSLRRGQPNSLKAGLLHGDQKEVHKLRRSFGLDKSDIGYPMPISVADVSHDGDQSMQLDCSVDLLITDKNPANMTIVDMSVFKDATEDSPGSVSRTNSSLSLTSAKSERADEENGYECDNESEVGSVVSTALKKKHIPLMTIESMIVNMKTDWTSQGSKEDGQKSLVHQKQESKDSLLSEASSAMSPLETFKSREMTRTLSADSGKGSICEEPQDNVDSTLDSVSSLVLNHGVSPKTTVAMDTLCSHGNNHKTIVAVDTCSVKESLEYEEVSTLQGSSSSPMDVNDATDAFSCESPSLKSNLAQKSVSTQDLQRETDTLQSRVSRSKSLLETSVTQKKTNIKPNLQISAETHKLLARAGYIKEQKTEMPKTDFDFTVPNTFPFIKQAEMLNPRRESIIALQKNNAGRVKNNVLQFDKISEEQKELEARHASPLRFPNSTSRKLRTPTLFNRSAIASNKDIDAIRQCLSTPKEKLQFGTAKVPISTQLIKPSDPDYTSTDGKSGTGLKRKPSIYKADHDSSIIRQRNNSHTVDTTMDCSHLDDHSFDMSESVFRNHQSFDMSDSVLRNHPSFDMSESVFGKTGLDQSLLETIANVCSPLSEKVKMKLNEDRIGKGDKENSAHAAEMPDLKPSILGTPISMDMVRFRTASNKTPLEIMKVARSPRSPIKPLKRLGSSPHSPRSRVHSPNLIKNSNRSRLSTIPNQSDDLNNL